MYMLYTACVLESAALSTAILTCRKHKEGVEKSTRQKEKKETYGVEHTGPEVVIIGGKSLRGVCDHKIGTQQSKQKTNAMGDRVQHLFKQKIAFNVHIYFLGPTTGHDGTHGVVVKCIAGEIE